MSALVKPNKVAEKAARASHCIKDRSMRRSTTALCAMRCPMTPSCRRMRLKRLFQDSTQEATLPAEELMLLKKGGDYGWPFCFYDPFVQKLILAPEYGGDGKKVGLCADKTPPAAAFAAHWGPDGAVHYDQKQFPA